MGLVLRLATLFSLSGGREKGNSGHFSLEACLLVFGFARFLKKKRGCLVVFFLVNLGVPNN